MVAGPLGTNASDRSWVNFQVVRQLSETTLPDLSVVPASVDRWRDIEKLFGPDGVWRGCWDMAWRVESEKFVQFPEWSRASDWTENKIAFQSLVTHTHVGLLAYVDSLAVGWCSVGPRENYPLLRTTDFPPDDQANVWAVVCFFIAEKHRREGVATALLSTAVEVARRNGARLLEGYPRRLAPQANADYTGTRSMYEKCGFIESTRANSGARHIMTRTL